MARRRIGLWLIGAKGGVAVSAITGLIAIRKRLTGPCGLVSELPLFRRHTVDQDQKRFVLSIER